MPVPGWYVPGPHEMQALELDAACTDWYEPAEHDRQLVAEDAPVKGW